MTLGVYLSFVAYACATTVLPGPNNVLLLASAGQFGFRRCLKLLLGIWSGFFASVSQRKGHHAGAGVLPKVLSALRSQCMARRSVRADHDCLFFCINQSAYDQFTDEQKAVIDGTAAKAVAYQIAINRENVEELVAEWTESGVMEVTTYDEIDTDSFKEACSGAEEWYLSQLTSTGMTEEEAQAYIDAFKTAE